VLVRPDQHVGWRGDAIPDDALALIDLIRGAAAGSAKASPRQAERAAACVA
jgi:hypothetical protein